VARSGPRDVAGDPAAVMWRVDVQSSGSASVGESAALAVSPSVGVAHRTWLSRQADLVAILAVSFGLGLYQIDWGLPNGNASWAADALGPLTVLSIARRSVGIWNSGWFYFKYPLGYPLVLLSAYAPFLALQLLTGDLRHPQATYPYGFSDPETSLYVMALLGRVVSALAITATVGFTFDIGRRLFSRAAGVLAAAFAATAYPLVYYAHTSNLDATFLFWQVLALWATVAAAQSGRPWTYAVLGAAAAMAVSTKEQAFALLLPLPVIVVLWRRRLLRDGRHPWREAIWNRGALAGILAVAATLVLVNNVLWNPGGFVNRILYLSGESIPGVSARLAPVEFALFKGVAKEYTYAAQLFDAVESSLGWPLLVMVFVGVCFTLATRPGAALLLLTPPVAHYYLSLRALDLITLRYALPLLIIGSLYAGALCAALLASRYRAASMVLVGALCVLGLARAVELDLLLRDDSRYHAEAWMRDHAPAGSRIEVYQKAAYVPRFPGFKVDTVRLAERTIEGVEARRPAYIVTSSAARMGITHRWNPDWRQGNTLLVGAPRAVELLNALQEGRLPYREVARFSRTPTLLRMRITSLCPEITIYERAVL